MKTILTAKNINQKVMIRGFVANKRKMGELTFIDLRNSSGITQIVFKNEQISFTKESVIEISGVVIERKDKNLNLPSGEIEIQVSDWKIISLSANELPFVIRDDLEAKEETRLKYRTLDLRRPVMQEMLAFRHKIIKGIRDFFDEREFLEIETPYLSKVTPEGARDFLVTTRKEGHFYALPQSPQIYKQLLMNAGVENYFQVARCFRDEDSRKDRQPEFTQLDIEQAYANEETFIKLIEELFHFLYKKINRKMIKFPFEKMKYDDAIDQYGSDKPDLRYEYKLINAKEYFAKSEFNVLKNAENIKMIIFDRDLSSKNIRLLEEIAKNNGAKGLFWASYNASDNKKTGPGFKFVPNEIELITQDLTNSWTVLIVAGEYDVVTQSLGAVRVKLNEMFNLASNDDKFVWIIDWPLFEFNEDGINAMHHPFTSPTNETLETFDKEPKKAKAKAYDITLNGFEIGGGSVRITDVDTQMRMFRTLGVSNDEANTKFGFLLDAFKYGQPQHAGIALGIDRLIMILLNKKSIRDVIAFPKNANQIAMMEDAPSFVNDDQLEQYMLKVRNEKQ